MRWRVLREWDGFRWASSREMMELCADGREVSERPEDAPQAIRQLAGQAGYEVVVSEGTLVVQPREVTGQLGAAMRYQFDVMNARGGTMHRLAAAIWGTLAGSVGGAKGYVTTIGDSTEAEFLTLPERKSVTTVEVMSLIVGQGSKGVWIMSEDRTMPEKEWRVNLHAYPYQTDRWALERLQCGPHGAMPR